MTDEELAALPTGIYLVKQLDAELPVVAGLVDAMRHSNRVREFRHLWWSGFVFSRGARDFVASSIEHVRLILADTDRPHTDRWLTALQALRGGTVTGDWRDVVCDMIRAERDRDAIALFVEQSPDVVPYIHALERVLEAAKKPFGFWPVNLDEDPEARAAWARCHKAVANAVNVADVPSYRTSRDLGR